MDNTSTNEAANADNPAISEKTPKSKWGITSLRIFWLGILASVTTYSHFFGTSYLNGKMAALGFEGIAFDLTAGQSLHFAVEGYTIGLKIAMLSIFKINILLVSISVVLGLGVIYINWKKELNQIWSVASSKVGKVQVTVSLPRWSIAPIKTVSFMVLPFLTIMWSYSLVLLFIIGLILVTALAVSFIGFGEFIGEMAGKDRMQYPTCFLGETTTKRALGCRIIELKNGQRLQGRRILTYNGVDYIVTNDGAYEVIDREVMSYKPIYCDVEMDQAAGTSTRKGENKRCSSKPYEFPTKEEQ